MPTRVLAFLVAACFFMENLDATIVTTALPTMARDLGIPTTDAGLIVTEHGIADLRGLSLRQRVQAMLAIAAHEHRDALAASARNLPH